MSPARLGQHFLRDARVADRILEAAEVEAGQRVLEIGPGEGVLTRGLAEAVAPGLVVAVEADRTLAARLDEAGLENLQVVHGDAVRIDLAALGPFDRVVSNLPYQISGPVTVRLLEMLDDQATRWGLAVLMYQKEFADRLLAEPGTKAYGRLTVHAAPRVRIESVRHVSPGCFHPPPRVQSTVLRFAPHETAPFDVADERLWKAVVDGAFNHRRKQLRNTVPSAVAGWLPADAAVRVLKDAGLADRRPEQMAPAEFSALVAKLADAAGPDPGGAGRPAGPSSAARPAGATPAPARGRREA